MELTHTTSGNHDIAMDDHGNAFMEPSTQESFSTEGEAEDLSGVVVTRNWDEEDELEIGLVEEKLDMVKEQLEAQLTSFTTANARVH